MKLKDTDTAWDATDNLQTDEDITLYLEAAFDEDPGDGSVIRLAIRDIARARNLTHLSEQIGMSRRGLHKALSPDGNPTFATMLKIVNALGIRLQPEMVAHHA